ncbi:MAG: hypothetical protein QOG56_1038 [Solirubrobacteraceae bacterium]|jgi:hypothetical protein|nr:hypothetical protein [Solirubrobacteraceae bacterium]
MVLALNAGEVLGGILAVGAIVVGVFFAAMALMITWEWWAQHPLIFAVGALLVVSCAIWLVWTSALLAR